MPDVIARKCNTADCQTPPILGTEEINLLEPSREYGKIYPDLGHLVLTYGQGHLDDLTAAAQAAGWHWDGTQWLCPKCHALENPRMSLADQVYHELCRLMDERVK